MTIAEVREACKRRFAEIPRDILAVGMVLGAAGVGFGTGFLAGQEAMPSTGGPAVVDGEGSTISPIMAPQTAAAAQALAEMPGAVVASKNGTKYYLPTCSGAKRISEGNKVWFASVAEARAQGYEPAANCKGLE